MAIRIGNHVRSGFINNTERDKVTGELHIAGIAEVVSLDLQGNAHPDMAGCVLEFSNPHATSIDPALAESFRTAHKGYAGDICASRKRKVPRGYPDVAPDFSFEPSDFVLTNILYLEWFDAYNGRIVIEGIGYDWKIDLPRWQLTELEIAAQANQAAEAANLFMNLALEHFEAVNEKIRAEEAEIDADETDEFAWEKRLQHSEDRVDAILTLLGEAETDEQRRALLDKAIGPDESGEELEFDELNPDEFPNPRDLAVLDEESSALAVKLGDCADRLIHDAADLISEDSGLGEVLTLAIKVKTVIGLILESDPPFDSIPEETLFDPGFIIALLKREIARCQTIVSNPHFKAAPEDHPFLDAVWQIRDLLVRLAGRLREAP